VFAAIGEPYTAAKEPLIREVIERVLPEGYGSAAGGNATGLSNIGLEPSPSCAVMSPGRGSTRALLPIDGEVASDPRAGFLNTARLGTGPPGVVLS
jgi:hypothetical protein